MDTDCTLEYYGARAMTTRNWPTRLTRHFFDAETRDFTLSCLRDLYKSLLVFTCATVFHFAVEMLVAVGFAVWATGLLTIIDNIWVIVTVTLAAWMFVGKIATGRNAPNEH
jgi:hypothetical protein